MLNQVLLILLIINIKYLITENFLFLTKSEDSPLKAIDFGLAKYCAVDDTLSSRAGTPIYIAPEVLLREYGQKADVWSAAIITYQVFKIK